jgi:hypothetical protein
MGNALRRQVPLERVEQDTPLATPRADHQRAARSPDRATLERIRAEFNEMRGFSPTPGQAARLFGLSREECERVLESLAREGFLQRDQDGRYRAR